MRGDGKAPAALTEDPAQFSAPTCLLTMFVTPVPEASTPLVASEGTAHTGDTGIHTRYKKSKYRQSLALGKMVRTGHASDISAVFIAISKGNSLAFLTAGADCVSRMDDITNILQNPLPLLNFHLRKLRLLITTYSTSPMLVPCLEF